MARPIRNNSSRQSRNNGIVSGATIQVINNSGVVGTVAPFITSGMKVATGLINVTGSVTNQTFTGISTIHQVLVQPASSSVTAYITTVGTAAAPSEDGYSGVSIHVYDYNGVVESSAVSLMYTVIGE